MTLDEAIEYYINVATQRAVADEGMGVNDKWNETKFMTKKESEQIIADNRQLAEWLMELKEAKRLLKAAVEDINYYVDCYEAHCDECCCDHDNQCHWKHEGEVLKLIGGADNDNL